MKYVKTYNVFEHQGTGDSTCEDSNLYNISNFRGTIKDFDAYFKSKMGETNPYKDNIKVEGPQIDSPHEGEKDNSLPYQDFQNGKSDLVKNRYGK